MYVSCDYQGIYPGGAAFPEPGSPDTVDIAQLDQAAFGIRTLSMLFKSNGYGTPFSAEIFAQDDDNTRSMWPLYSQLAMQGSPASLLVSIRDASIFGSVITCGPAENRRIVYETQRPNDRDATTPPPGADEARDERVAGDTGVRKFFFLGSAGSFNYGHFLVDDLPRAAAIDRLRAQDPTRPVTVLMTGYGEVIDTIRRTAIRRLYGETIGVEFLERDRSYRVSTLYYATPVSSHPIRKHVLALADLAKRAGERVPPSDEAGELVYLSRGGTGNGRRLLNEGDIVARLMERGFSIVRPDTLSFDDQVAALRNARIVVGPMGAAMTNTTFAPADAHIVYLAPQGWIEPFYWDLAKARHQTYRVLYGPGADTDTPANLVDFRVPLAALDTVLDRIAVPSSART